MERKISIIVTIILAGVILCLHSSFRGLHDQIRVLTNENDELQSGLNTLPFIHVGREYLDGLNKTTGRIVSIRMEEKAPLYALPHKPSAEEYRLCWVMRFEQATYPGRFFEVWVAVSERKVIGMDQSRGVGWAESCEAS
jgi:hypothetical protein